MITQARITEDIGSAGLDWITALRAPASSGWSIAARCNSRCSISATWRASPHLTSPASAWWSVAIPISPPSVPASAKTSAATERDLARIQTAVVRKRDPLRGTAEIALAVGAVINKHKMAKHFELDITDAAFSFARKTTEIAAEAATDGVYVIRTSLPAETFDDATTVRSYKSLALVDAPFAASRPSICTCGRSITDWPIGSARMSSSACSPITSNGTCASASRRCCSTTPTKQRPRHGVPAWWRRRSAHRGCRQADHPPDRRRAAGAQLPLPAGGSRPWHATPSSPRSHPTCHSPCSQGRPRYSTRHSPCSESRCSQ